MSYKPGTTRTAEKLHIHLIEIYLSTMLIRPLRIWNGTKERKTDTAA